MSDRELRAAIEALPGWEVTSGIQRDRTVESPDAVDRGEVLRLLAAARVSGDREDGLRTALERQLAEPTTDVRTLAARTLFDKARRSATSEVTITAQGLRVLLPQIESEAVSLVIRAALASPAPEPRDGLDAAWREAEAALPDAAAQYMADDPEGDWSSAAWSLTVSGPGDTATYTASFEDAAEAEMIPGCFGEGTTPAAALRALSARLQATDQEEPSRE